jgi:hypothetical protein
MTTLGSGISITHLLLWRLADAGKARSPKKNGRDDDQLARTGLASEYLPNLNKT